MSKIRIDTKRTEAKLNQIFFGFSELGEGFCKRLIDYRKFPDTKFQLLGMLDNVTNVNKGLIRTSVVVDLNDKQCVTESGSLYEFDSMHPDYIDYLDAIDNGIPIITSFAILGDSTHGFKLIGKSNDQKEDSLFSIKSQNNNRFVVLDSNENELTLFVDWFSFKRKSNIFLWCSRYCKIRFTNQLTHFLKLFELLFSGALYLFIIKLLHLFSNYYLI